MSSNKKTQPPPIPILDWDPNQPDFDWEAALKHLLGYVLSEADIALRRPESNVTLIESGKKDVTSHMLQLFLLLRGFKEPDRRSAYAAIFNVVRGVFHIGSYAVIPAAAIDVLGKDQAAFMRRRKKQRSENPKRDAIVRAVFDNAAADITVKALLPLVNTRLVRDQLKEISLDTLYRILRQQSH